MSSSTIPMFSPEGKLAEVPQEKYRDAVGQQFTPAVAVTSPEGQDAYLPHDKVSTALQDHNFALGPSSQQPRTKMYTKSGQYAEVPQNAHDYAEQQGWKQGVQMTTPTGIELTVHPDEAKKALDLGWGIGPSGQQDKPGFLARTIGGLAGVDSTDIANGKFKNSNSGKGSDPLYNAGSLTYGKNPESDADILKYGGINQKTYDKLDDQQKNLVLMEAKARLGIPWEDKVAENLPIAGSMIRSGTKAVKAAKEGKISEAIGHAAATPMPVVGAMAEGSGEEFGQGHVREGLQNAALTLAPFVAGPVVEGMGKLAGRSNIVRSPLSKAVLPDDVEAFHTAEELAKPAIATAAKEVGVKLENTDGLLQAVKQAKQNTLLDAHNAAGDGKTVTDLAPEDQKALSQKMASLDAVQKHVEDAAAIAKDAPEQPGKKDAAMKVLSGASKMAVGAGLSHIIPGGHWGLEIAGIGWGMKDLGSGLHDLVRTPILNETRLNGAIKDTFSSVKPEVRPATLPDETTKPPYEPATGDLGVEHSGNVAPPKQPHGEVPVTPDEEPAEPEKVSPYTSYSGNRTVTHETNVAPPTQPGGDLHVTPDDTVWPQKPEIKPPTEDEVKPVESSPEQSINLPKVIRDPKTGKFQKNPQRGSSTTEEDSDALSKLPRIQVGTAAGAQNDTALFAQAKKNLGPDATLSQIAQEAQRMKMNQTPISNKVGGYNPSVETAGLPESLKRVNPAPVSEAGIKKTYYQYDIPRLKKLLSEASDEDKPYYQSMIDQLTEKQKNTRGSGRAEEFTNLPFFSRAANVVKEKLAPWFSPDQALNTLKNAGVSTDELDVVKPWLDQQGKKVSKQDLLNHIETNGLKVNVIEKGQTTLHPDAQKALDDIADPEVKAAMKDILENGHYEDRMEYDHGMLAETYGLSDEQGIELDRQMGKFSIIDKHNLDVPADKHKFNLLRDQATDEFLQKHQTNRLPYDDKLEELPESQREIENRAHELYKEAGGKYGTGGTQYGEYTLPGGQNYREMLIQAPIKDIYDEPNNFSSGHFEEPNVLAHVRMNDRMIDGKKTLFVEEVQSDWHQQGREKGYIGHVAQSELDRVSNLHYEKPFEELTEEQKEDVHQAINAQGTSGNVPNAPFKKDWHELAMKQVLDTAVREGYDQVGWTKGAQQIDRYEEPLRQNVQRIEVTKLDDGTVNVKAFDHSLHVPLLDGDIPLHGIAKVHGQLVGLDELVGKEMANQIRTETPGNLKGQIQHFSGDDLSIGGSGMKGFYDKILPDFMNRYTKKWGGRVKQSDMDSVDEGVHKNYPVHTIEITPKMKEEIKKKGQPISGLIEKPNEVAA